MGIQINGQTDIISATDGALNVSGASLGSASASSLNISGIVTATQVKVGSAITIHSAGIDLGSGTLTSHNINSIGVITATSFVGSGANLNSLVVSGVTTATGGVVVGESFIKSNSIGIGTTTTNGRNAGVSTATGTIIFNNTKSSIEAYSGSGWFDVKNVGLSSSIVVLTSSQTFIVPDGIYKIKVTITGAGGGGYSGTYNRGGGAGGTAIKYINVTPGQGIGVTIGAAGAANSNTTGGTSHFGSYCSATGGYGAGSDGDYSDNSSRGGIGVNGDINAQGGSAQTHDGGIVAGSKGGDSFWGGGARGKSNGRYYGEGGGNYGGGGGGGTYTAGGGSNGVCVIEWVL